jgi:hypothetical protein
VAESLVRFARRHGSAFQVLSMEFGQGTEQFRRLFTPGY